jgi:hypothetical protein
MSTWVGPEDIERNNQYIAAREAKRRERAKRRLANTTSEDGSAQQKRRLIPIARVIFRLRKP